MVRTEAAFKIGVAANVARLNKPEEAQRRRLSLTERRRSSLKTAGAELLRRSDQKCRAFLSTAATRATARF